jgi:pilus assembly protein CpaE
MRTFIVSDHDQSTRRVRGVLLREAVDCPQEHLLPLSVDMLRLRKQEPELIVLVLQPDPEEALTALARLRQLPGCAVVVVGPGEDSRLVLRVCHIGVRDYIDENEFDEALPAAIQRLRSENATHVKVEKTIAVYSPSGGCGVSTLAVNLAVLLAKEHEKTLLIDLNLHTGDLSALLDLRPTHTLADLCAQAGHLDRTMLDRTLVPHASGIHLLAPPLHLADAERITPEGVRHTISLGRRLFPHVVVDLEHVLSQPQEQVLHMADMILLVVRLDFTVLRNARRIMEHFDRLNVSRERVRVVANRYGQSKEVPYRKAEEGLGVKIYHYVPDDPKTVNRANNCGVPVVLESPYAKVSRSLTKLVKSVAASMAAAKVARAE